MRTWKYVFEDQNYYCVFCDGSALGDSIFKRIYRAVICTMFYDSNDYYYNESVEIKRVKDDSTAAIIHGVGWMDGSTGGIDIYVNDMFLRRMVVCE